MTRPAAYPAALQTTLRSTAAAYGYTLTIATTSAMLTSTAGSPRAGDLFLFVAGGLLAFGALDGILVLTRREDVPDVESAFPLAGVLNVVSVSGGLGAATGLAHAVSGALAWLVSPLAATAAYMLLVAIQVTVVRRFRATKGPRS